jgi:hypothetical protein
MPVAVVTEESERFELKTLREGYVVVKRMTYGQHLYRKSIGAKIMLAGAKSDHAGEVVAMQEAVALWEFANLVADHNLTDADGRQLNFKDANDVKRLAGRVGDEITSYIEKLNNFEEELEEGNSSGASAPSS